MVRMSVWHDLGADLRLALRQARRRPAFSLTCVTVLALGLGAGTAVFSALYAAVLRPLPYVDAGRLVAVHNRFPGLHLARLGASSLDYLDLREHRELFADAGAFYFQDLNRTGVERPEKVNAVAITASLFRTLGVRPLLGRNFTAEEERYHGPHAVMVSEAYWRSALGGDPRVLHRSLQLDGELYPIVGVMPPTFRFPNDVTQMWTPVTFQPRQLAPAARTNHYLHMFARLAPGLDFEEASARMERLSRAMSLEHPEDYPLARLGWRFFLLPMARDDDGSLRAWLFILFAAVTFLLVIVCSNVAGLLLVRSTQRQSEMALRMALGASPSRLARQVLTEVLVLACGGGLAGLLVARVGASLLARYGPTGRPELDTAVFLFAAGLTVATGMACGIWPAWTAMRVAPRKLRLRHALVVGQVAMATTLLISGGLLIRSLIGLLKTPPGFDARNVLTMQISLPRTRYRTDESRAQFYAAVLERVREIPGVTAASACTLLPFGYGEDANTFEIVGRPKPRVEPYANLNNVLPDFLRTMRVPLVRGRWLTPQDRAGSQPVALIDQTLARRYFAGEDPVGQQIRMPWDKPFTVVGVVGSVRTAGLDVDSRPTLYFSALQYPSSDMSLVVRSARPAGATADAVQRIVTQIDKDQPVYDLLRLDDRIDASTKTRRFVVFLVTAFAAVGTLLAALGLYGVLAFTVALRRREIGIRVALGADRRRIALLVSRGGAVLAGGGVMAGSVGAIAVHRYLASQLYGVGPGDGATWVAVIGMVILTCSLACAVPAWRAARVDPMESLREQ
jgi:putative ABC transport system permease protein